MKYLHISAKVERRIESLKRSGKAGTVLAHKVTRIIKCLTSGTIRHHMDANDSYTKYGERRIKKCRKYDLGSGYRLITLQRGNQVFIPFLGTHDACQRWLEKNSRMKSIIVGKGRTLRVSSHPPSLKCRRNDCATDSDPDVNLKLQHRLTDMHLRRIFCGLTGETGRSSPL